MLIKNLSRKGGGSAPVLKYIFRYVFREATPVRGRYRKSDWELSTSEQRRHRIGYVRALKSVGVRFTRKDINYLMREEEDAKLQKDFIAKTGGQDAVKYIKEYLLATTEQKENQPFVMTHNIRPYRNLNDIIRQFEQNEDGRISKRKDSPTIHHTIISFGSKDNSKITDDILKDLVSEYIKLRGENLLFAVAKHEDKDHIHAHLCMSASTTDGRSARISRKEFAEIKDKLQEYQKQKYPFLEHSLPEHGKKQKAIEKGEWKSYIRDERSSIKNRLFDTISSIRPEGTKELLEQLEAQGYVPYYRASTLTGVRHLESNLKFRFNRLGVDIEELKRIDEQHKKEEELLQQIAGVRRGERQHAPEMGFETGRYEREEIVRDTDDRLKDIEALREDREQDDERDISDTVYDADDSSDTDDSDDERYSADAHDEEPDVYDEDEERQTEYYDYEDEGDENENSYE